MEKTEFLKECSTLYQAMVGTGVKVKKKLSKKDQEDPESFMKVLDKGSDDAKCPANQKDRFNELCDLFEGLGENDTQTSDTQTSDTQTSDTQPRPEPAGEATNIQNTQAATTSTQQPTTQVRTRTVKPKIKTTLNPLEAAVIDLMSKVPEKEIENLKAATMVTVLRVSKK